MRIGEHDTHPIADYYHPHSESEFKGLVSGLKEVGLLEPITLFDGRILDGRHRYKACLEAKVEPRFDEFNGTEEEAVKFVENKNSHRRHSNEWQHAQQLVALSKHYAALERDRRRLEKRQAALPIVSDATIEQVEAIEAGACDELKEALERNDVSMSIAAAIAGQDPDVQAGMVSEIRKVLERDVQPIRAVTKPKVTSLAVELTDYDINSAKTAALSLARSAQPELRWFASLIPRLVPGVP